MKKKLFILCVALFALLAVTFIPAPTEKPYSLEVGSASYVEGTYPTSLEELASSCNTIVMATVESVRDFLGTQEVTLRVDTTFKGIEEQVIHQYDSHMEIGKTYLLFLTRTDTPSYPHPHYTLGIKDAVYEVDKDKLISLSQVGNDYRKDAPKTLSKMIDWLAAIPSTYVEEDVLLFDELPPLEQAVAMADLIARVRPMDIHANSEYNVSAKLVFSSILKGTVDETGYSYGFPTGANLEEGKEYIVLWTQPAKNSVMLLARNGAVISQDDTENWNKVLELTGK